jgi:cytochrome P450
LSLDEEVAALLNGQRLRDPFPTWNRLREEAPVYAGSDMVIVSRYADVKAMLPDKERYSGKQFVGGSRPQAIFATFSEDTQELIRGMVDSPAHMVSLSGASDPDHRRLRGIAHRFFTPRQIQQMEGRIQAFCDDLLAEAAEQEVYDHKVFAQNLALRVITDIVGAPEVDGPYVLELVERTAHFLGGNDEKLMRDAYFAREEFNEYIQRTVLADYRRNSENEFVRAMMDAEGQENLSPVELCGMVYLFIFGGTDTTSVLLSTGLLELLGHRDQWEWLCDDPAARVPGAVEELFRYVSPAQTIPRTAAIDFTLDGVDVPAGETVMASIPGANRDPAQYEKPDQLDITRGRAHLALGIGHKFCLGASVIRAEARIALTTLAERYPDVELAIDPDDLDWSGGPVGLRSVRELPIKLGEKRRH